MAEVSYASENCSWPARSSNVITLAAPRLQSQTAQIWVISTGFPPVGKDHEGDPTSNAGRGSFPRRHSALMHCAARLRHIAGTQWGAKRYLNIDLLKGQEVEQWHSMAEAI